MNKLYIEMESGQTLLEVLIALTIAIVLISITSVAIVTSFSNASKSKSRSQAQAFSQQGVEILRQMRDTSWTTFDTFSGSYCLASTCTEITSSAGSCGPKIASCGMNVDTYSREVKLEKSSSLCSRKGKAATRATVTVSWSDSACTSASDFCKNVVVETCFANIYGNVSL